MCVCNRVCMCVCVCVPVYTRRPEENIQCPPLSLSAYPLEAGSLPEYKDPVFSMRLEVSSLSNPLASALCGTGGADRCRTPSLIPGFWDSKLQNSSPHNCSSTFKPWAVSSPPPPPHFHEFHQCQSSSVHLKHEQSSLLENFNLFSHFNNDGFWCPLLVI